MQGLIFDIKHYAVHDGPGIRQTIFFKGCPLSCWWCHNPESQSSKIEHYTKKKTLEGKSFQRKEEIGYFIDSSELMKTIQKDVPFYDESGGGVTFSGGEPLMQTDFLVEIASQCTKNHIHTALDTSGYTSRQNLTRVLPYIDLFLFDLKIMDNPLHKKYTGVSNHQILENLNFLLESDQPVRIRFPVIPGVTDTTTNLEEIKNFLHPYKNIQAMDILPYHTISKAKYKRFDKSFRMNGAEMKEGSENTLKKEFEALGIHVHIGG